MSSNSPVASDLPYNVHIQGSSFTNAGRDVNVHNSIYNVQVNPSPETSSTYFVILALCVILTTAWRPAGDTLRKCFEVLKQEIY